MSKSFLARSELIKYNHPLAEKARHFAHHVTWGKQEDMVVICRDQYKRHLLMLALMEWCDAQGWPCNEYSVGRFSMRGGVIEFVIGTPDHLDGRKVEISIIGKDDE